jgi:hypothetical protein
MADEFDDRGRDDACTVARLFCGTLAFPFLLFGGVLIAESMGGRTRTEQIAIYNNAVTAWQNGGKKAWMSSGPMTVSVTCTSMLGCGTPNGVTTNLTLGSSVVDPVAIEQGGDIIPYSDDLKAVYQSSAGIFSAPRIQSSNTAKATVSLSRLSNATSSVPPSCPSRVQADLSYFSQVDRHSSCEYGEELKSKYFLGLPQCVGYFVPDISVGPLCLVVDEDSQIVGGCGVMSETSVQALKFLWRDSWFTHAYAQSSAPWKVNYFSFQYTPSYPSSFAWPANPAFPSVVVRSVNDPFVVFLGLTGGYSTFGYREQATHAEGMRTLFVGFLFLFPFWCPLLSWIFWSLLDAVDDCRGRWRHTTTTSSSGSPARTSNGSSGSHWAPSTATGDIELTTTSATLVASDFAAAATMPAAAGGEDEGDREEENESPTAALISVHAPDDNSAAILVSPEVLREKRSDSDDL